MTHRNLASTVAATFGTSTIYDLQDRGSIQLIQCFESNLIIDSMRLSLVTAVCSILARSFCSSVSNLTSPQTSQQVLRSDFKPPPVFQNVNLVRNTNLDKGYVRETINIVIENVDKESQSEYYLPFEYHVIAKVGGIEARDKKNPEKGRFDVRMAAMSALLGDDGAPTEFVIHHHESASLMAM